ncbi:ABC transporter substrate-binding protein [Paenibacillus mendelii]|uniref:ABC transporter substrate-binding protein n=1 Tax=Paenibacillus mendelii TaxID=206163 RepID=A0ABV6JE06_9BACL|nr:extracellular solute-binding protein [Paenibacillus mendelii]MCQ6563466.1 extracellular solute-binding protein [Paenibacillus mendelii]
MNLNRRWVLALLAMIVVLSGCSSSNVGSGGGGASDEQSGTNGTTIEIALMSANPYLDEAIKQYKKIRPDVHIETKEYKATPQIEENTSSEPLTKGDIEKYVQSVSTQLMSGKGADIIVMNELPKDKYVAKNMLVNFYDLMDKDADFDRNQYYQNIFKNSQNGDGLYAMPFSFALDAFTGNKDLLKQGNIEINDQTWTWDDFKTISKKLKEQVGDDHVTFGNLFPVQLLSEYIEANYNKLIDQGQANFDSDLFRDMMKQIKSMYDEGVLNAEFMEYSESLFNNANLLDPITGLAQVLDPKFTIYQKPTVNGQYSGTPFKSYFTLGMNSKSKVQDEAWKFIKFMLSEEMQSSPMVGGFAMHKGVVEKQLGDAKQQAVAGTLTGQKFDTNTVESKIKELHQLIDGASTNLSSDFKVISIAIEEFDSYMSGQKSVEDVSKLIQNRVNTYINE